MLNRTSTLALAAGACAAFLSAGQAAAASHEITLKFADFAPAQASTARMFKEYVAKFAEKSGGKLKLQLFHGSSMGPMPRHYDLARKGVADLSFFQHGVTPGRFPLVELTHAPYLWPPGFKGVVVGAKATADLTAEYFAPEHKGTKILYIVFNRPSGVYDSTKPIRSLADLKGRRYRAPTPTDVAMMKALGALPIGLPAPLMAESLQKKTIDGVVTDPMGIFAFKLAGLVKHYSNMFVSAISFGVAMNEASYRKLPADLRAIIDDVSGKAGAVRMATLSWGDFPVFLDYMKKADIAPVEISEAANAEMRSVAARVMEEKVAALEKKGLPGRDVYTRLKALSAKYAAE